MTSETPRQNPGDDEVFAALMRQNWEKEPTLRESIDPGILRVLEEARTAEEALNSATDLSEATIQEVLLSLNEEWRILGLQRKTLAVTGKLRPTDVAIDEDVWEVTEEGAFPGLSSKGEDLRGDFTQASAFRAMMQGFDVEKLAIGEDDEVYRIVMQFSLDEDYNDENIWFTAYPEEIEYIETYLPTREGAAEFVRVNFPDVYEAVQALPENCQDAELIHQSLDNFVVAFDLSKADTTMGQDEVLDIIEMYITDHIGFDNAAYDASVCGKIYGRKFDYTPVEVAYDGTLRDLLVANIRLVAIPNYDDESGMKQYRPEIETWYLTPEAHGGRTPIYIPIDSLKALASKRPVASEYPFGQDVVVFSEDQFGQASQPTPLRQSESDEGTVSQHETSPASEKSRLEIVKEFKLGLEELHKRLYEYVNPARRYPDEISLTTALSQVQNIITPFIERWKPVMTTEPIPVEVMGSGLLIPNAEVQQTGDPEVELINYEIRGLDIQEADSFSTRRGLFIGIHTSGGQVVDGEGYVMRAITVFRDIQQNGGVIIDDPYFHQPMMTIRVTRNFFANMADLDLEFTAIEADRIERRNRALESIVSIDVPARLRSRLGRQLRHLADGIDAEDGSSYMRYEHTDELNDMALVVGGNREASHALSYALQEVIGTPRSIKAGGAIIVGEDERDDSAIIFGQLQGVIAEHPWLKAPEPTLLVSIAASDDSPERFNLVPLSTIEYLEY